MDLPPKNENAAKFISEQLENWHHNALDQTALGEEERLGQNHRFPD
jgi:hypothetical protein